MPLGEGDSPKLKPLTEVGSGSVQERQKALLSEIIEKRNGVFGGEMTDGDLLSFSESVRVKLQESATLTQPANSNLKEQFASSPDLDQGLTNAVVSALDAHTSLSTQFLNSETVRDHFKAFMLGPGRLYETLREQYVADATKI